MLTRLLRARIAARMLVATMLLFMLVACGNASNSTTGSTSSQQKSDSSGSSTQTLEAIDFNIANMHIHAGNGIACINYGTVFIAYPTYFNANLVLAKSRLTYDSSELQQMQTYADFIYGTSESSSIPSIPSTLQWDSGTKTSNIIPFPGGLYAGGGCFGELELTNIGNSAIRIRSMSMQLTTVPQKNSNNQYRMIDICSLIGRNFDCPPKAGGGAPVKYYYQLKVEPSGTLFAPLNQVVDPNYQVGTDLILNPNVPISMLLYFTSLNPLTYSLTPNLVLATANGTQQIVPLAQLSTTVNFANPNQFSCYTLQGDTFVQYKASDNGYCV